MDHYREQLVNVIVLADVWHFLQLIGRFCYRCFLCCREKKAPRSGHIIYIAQLYTGNSTKRLHLPTLSFPSGFSESSLLPGAGGGAGAEVAELLMSCCR
jgi:hypothetical protein